MNMRLIDANKLISDIQDLQRDILTYRDYGEGMYDGLDKAIELINQAEVFNKRKRKHGHWDSIYRCSVCGAYMAIYCLGDALDKARQHYCYNCGAKMDGEKDD